MFLFAQSREKSTLRIVSESSEQAFPLVDKQAATPFLTDVSDAEVVTIAARAVASDLALITGVRPKVVSSLPANQKQLIIAGTIGHSAAIDQLVQVRKLDISAIGGKWESFIITLVQSPMPGVDKALVVTGSDRRGTAYGLFELSRLAGVSPWVWWADVKPEPRKALYVLPGTLIQHEPAVKYRGIFINDEDWGLNPWAARNMDTDIKDIGPKTYARVFELLLRLRANLIWPAMHDSTNAFWFYPENPKVADRYAIVMGSTHCDMMMRSNTFEWQKNYEHEYGIQPGPYRYDVNKAQVYKYWDDRVAAAKNYESIYTIGMRGIRDGGMTGPPTSEGKIALLDTVIRDQRGILQHHLGQPTQIPQLFCPYKEVLGLYLSGLKIPDDVTLVWTDDSFGYIRQLSNPEEQKRSGASGIYYHLSYLGGPHDYLWLSTNAPSLISYEMTKAYQFGANRFWVVNVGDIKPAELETQFFLDLAWEPTRWTPEKAHTYVNYWAEQTFGKAFALDIAAIKQAYYELAQSGKPEHLGVLRYDNASKTGRLSAYAGLVEKVNRLKARIPERLQHAFFELIEYPVKGAALMNEKIFYAQLSLEAAESAQALTYSRRAKDAYDQIKQLTQYYNTGIEDGKWNGIITYAPRNLSVYGMPNVAKPEVLGESSTTVVTYDRRYLDTTKVDAGLQPGIISLSAATTKQAADSEQIITVAGLGLGGNSISRYPFTGPSFNKESFSKAPYVDYVAPLKAGTYNLSLKCLPSKAIHKGRHLGLAVSVNGQAPQFADVNNPQEDKVWKASLLRGYSEAILPIQISKDGNVTIRIYLLDTGLALSRLDITDSQTSH
ncbi:MAG: glycosyl hydrolase 115 family protein [Siphonobacter sp.]